MPVFPTSDFQTRRTPHASHNLCPSPPLTSRRVLSRPPLITHCRRMFCAAWSGDGINFSHRVTLVRPPTALQSPRQSTSQSQLPAPNRYPDESPLPQVAQTFLSLPVFTPRRSLDLTVETGPRFAISIHSALESPLQRARVPSASTCPDCLSPPPPAGGTPAFSGRPPVAKVCFRPPARRRGPLRSASPHLDRLLSGQSLPSPLKNRACHRRSPPGDHETRRPSADASRLFRDDHGCC